MSSLNIVLNTHPPPVALSSNRQEAPAAEAASIGWAALVAQIHANDDTAMQQLYKQFNRGVRHLFLRQLGPEHIDDRVRNTFQLVVKAIRRGDLEEPEPLWGLVRTTAQRQVAAYINEVARQRCPEGEAGVAGPCLADRKANPEWKVWEYQRAELVKSVLLRLSDRDQEILRRLYLMGQTDDQIQAEMSLTEPQLRVLKPRAKQHFGKHWKKKSRKKLEFASGPSQAAPLRNRREGSTDTLCLQHLSDELLERYLMRQVSESKAEAVETHLLTCDSCPERLDELEDYRDVMRMGFTLLAAEETQIQAALARARELWLRNVESGTTEPGGSVGENKGKQGESRGGENRDGEKWPQLKEPRARFTVSGLGGLRSLSGPYGTRWPLGA